MIQYPLRYDLSLGGWEDGFMAEDNDPYPRQSFRNQEDIAYSWSNVWEWGTSMRAYRLANRGYKVSIQVLAGYTAKNN